MLTQLFGYGKKIEKTVTSVDRMTLVLCGMRGSSVYKFESEANQTELRLYREKYSGKETILELEQSVVCSPETIINLMNTCGVIHWKGFHGKHPKNVCDGIMFRFEATVNGGQTISADGSENFPKGYREFVSVLNSMLTESNYSGNAKTNFTDSDDHRSRHHLP